MKRRVTVFNSNSAVYRSPVNRDCVFDVDEYGMLVITDMSDKDYGRGRTVVVVDVKFSNVTYIILPR